MKPNLQNWAERLHQYRFEALLLALLLLLFDKIFFWDANFFTQYIWPFNMIALGLAAWGIFKERSPWLQALRNGLFVCSLIIPLSFRFIAQDQIYLLGAISIYVLYYGLIFVELLRQITQRSEARLSVIFGAICGFLLLIVVAQFCFLALDHLDAQSFNGLKGSNIPARYNELSYFSMVTLATVGYGDITPATEAARLCTLFFAIAGQFYMVALVGIIVSRFSANNN